jgi:hypothetical protein
MRNLPRSSGWELKGIIQSENIKAATKRAIALDPLENTIDPKATIGAW